MYKIYLLYKQISISVSSNREMIAFNMWLVNLIAVITVVAAMHMPEDTEILDGYDLDTSPEIDPEESFSEVRSLLGYHRLFKPIRDKRSPDEQYAVLESQGLTSHFRPNGIANVVQVPNSDKYTDFTKNTDYMQNIAYNRLRPPPRDGITIARKVRSADETTVRAMVSEETVAATGVDETLPTAEKQVMSTGSGFRSDIRNSPVMADHWSKTPFEYSKVLEEEDSIAEASVNEGIKTRQPRVNFITQQKKKSTESTESTDDQNQSASKAEVYQNAPDRIDDRRNNDRRRYEEPDNGGYLRRYDRLVSY